METGPPKRLAPPKTAAAIVANSLWVPKVGDTEPSCASDGSPHPRPPRVTDRLRIDMGRDEKRDKTNQTMGVPLFLQTINGRVKFLP